MSKSRLRIETESFDHLTNRQVEIVRLLAVGLAPREIAVKLFLSAALCVAAEYRPLTLHNCREEQW